MSLVFGLFLAAAILSHPTYAQTPSTENPPGPNASAQAASELAPLLVSVRRIYVESFGEDTISRTLHGAVISSLTATKRFVITENRDRADAVLKGGSLERTSQEFHALGSGTSVAGAAGGYSGSSSGSISGSIPGSIHGSSSGSSSGGFIARSLGIDDSQASTETINEARLAVRLVSLDGDVIWSTTQESKGAKFKGAAPDVADKVASQLIRDIEKLERSGVKPTTIRRSETSTDPPTSSASAPLSTVADAQGHNDDTPIDPANSKAAVVSDATIVITSTPAGAEITIDGKFVGSTPSTIRLPAGDHEILIVKNVPTVKEVAGGEVTVRAYKTWKRSLTVNAGSTITIDAALEPIP